MSDQKEGTWRVVQPNGREYLVHTQKKAAVAMSCGYTVERIDDAETAAGICEQVAAQSNNHLFRSGAKICAAEIRRAGAEVQSKAVTHTLSGFMAAHLALTGYPPSDQEIFNAGVRAGKDLAAAPAQTDRIAELERERDHWKANHDQQVERARVLMERTDMPVERTRAYQHMRTLQRLVDVQKMLLEAFTGQLERPEGKDPFNDETGEAFDASFKRLTDAYCLQQPLPVPDQMALVWRIDIGRLRSSWIQRDAFFRDHRTDGTVDKIRQAIRDYHAALDARAHGGIAQDRAFNTICQALDMNWEQGKELQRRAEAALGELTEQINEGKPTC